ncbi:MAG: 3'(2'),5'-bisphosphate nucleotidase [Acidimicrobiaceae bacterium]|nr:3'(2'),5'-bisphosphate nucleotidase [Acidimicrobiaceae bacterium]
MVTDLERTAALDAVRSAAALCAAAQGRLVAGETLTKGDDSPVTVADFAAQAVVVESLARRLGAIELVGEEDPADLVSDDQATLRDGVTGLVAAQLGRDVAADQVLEWIGVGDSDGSPDRYWTLDPIDGTKGFLRGDQYAIALALIEDGEVVLGVLGCPNLPNGGGTIGSIGSIFVATDDGCEAYPTGGATVGGDTPVAVRVAQPASLAEARFCESVEAGHSDHDDAAEIAERLGIVAEPYRIDSQCKYAAVARGDASIYLRLPTRPGYREKIWDHAAGKFVVERAGGVVTDVDGAPLDFRHGRRLEHNRGIVATSGRFHDQVVSVVRDVLA